MLAISNSKSALLTVDAMVNLVLGVLLMAFPAGLVDWLGVPAATSSFYPSLLGAVLFGIGIALWLGRKGTSGLGLAGAISINLCGGIVLAVWLLLGNLAIPGRGQVFLWFLVLLLVGLSGIELITHFGKARGDHAN